MINKQYEETRTRQTIRLFAFFYSSRDFQAKIVYTSASEFEPFRVIFHE